MLKKVMVADILNNSDVDWCGRARLVNRVCHLE